MLDDKGRDIFPEIERGTPRHGTILEYSCSKGRRQMGCFLGVAEHEGADYHGALRKLLLVYCRNVHFYQASSSRMIGITEDREAFWIWGFGRC